MMFNYVPESLFVRSVVLRSRVTDVSVLYEEEMLFADDDDSVVSWVLTPLPIKYIHGMYAFLIWYFID